jgi:hypothetical protein
MSRKSGNRFCEKGHAQQRDRRNDDSKKSRSARTRHDLISRYDDLESDQHDDDELQAQRTLTSRSSRARTTLFASASAITTICSGVAALSKIDPQEDLLLADK